MRLAFLPILAILLYSAKLSNAEDELNKNYVLFGLNCSTVLTNVILNNAMEITSIIFPKYSKNEHILDNICPEVLLLILEQLDFPDLLRIAQVNNELLNLASDIFRRRYLTVVMHQETLRVTSMSEKFMKKIYKRFNITKNNERDMYWVDDSRLYIFEYDMILKTLEIFRSVITKLELSYHRFYPHSKRIFKINEAINRQLRYSLVELRVENFSERSLDGMTMPFEKVETMEYFGYLPQSNDGLVRMNEMFPAIRNLSLHTWKTTDYLDCHFPHLKHLYLETIYSLPIFGMIQKNPQIESIESVAAIPKFLKSISEELPNLKNLTISRFEHPRADIRYENVTKFVMFNNIESPEKFIIPNLEEVHFNTDGDHFERWIDFVKMHKSLKRIHMYYANIDEEQFEQFSKHISNIVDMNLTLVEGEPINIHSVIALLKINRQISNFNAYPCTEADQAILWQELAKEATVSSCE